MASKSVKQRNTSNVSILNGASSSVDSKPVKQRNKSSRDKNEERRAKKTEGIETKKRVEEELEEGFRLMDYTNIITQTTLRNKNYEISQV